METWLLLVLGVLILSIVGGIIVLLRGRTPAGPASNSDTIDMETNVRDGTTIADLATPRRSRRIQTWRDRVSPLGMGLAAILLVGLVIAGIVSSTRGGSSTQFVVVVTPFNDGGDGTTGANVANALGEQLRTAGGDIIQVIVADQAPDSPQAAFEMATAKRADLLVWGNVAPGAMLDSASLQPRLIYTPNSPYAPYAWDGYVGRFAMPRSFSVATEPINGQVVLVPLVLTLADYSLGSFDSTFDDLGSLAETYPLAAPLPRSIRGNILWARGAYDAAAGEYRRALAAGSDEQALLVNNLSAILFDAGNNDALSELTNTVQLLDGRDLGELRFNLGLVSQRQQAYDAAISEFTQALNLLPPSTPLLLAAASAQRDAGNFPEAAAILDMVERQSARDVAAVPAAFRPTLQQHYRADLSEQQAMLAFAQLVGAGKSIPIEWELEVSPPGATDELTTVRNRLTTAIATTEDEVVAWRQRAVTEAAATATSNGLTANGQAERAQQRLYERQYHLALVLTELGRTTLGNSRGAFSRFFGLFGGQRNPLTTSRDLLDELIASNPDDIATRTAYARALRLSGSYDAANQQNNQIIAIAPDRPEGYYGNGMLSVALGDRDGAKQQLAQAVERDSDFYPARAQIAKLAEQEADWAVAIEQYRAVATQRPSTENILKLATLLRQSGPENYAEAEQLLQPLTDTNSAALIEFGRIYDAEGNIDAAIKAFEDARVLDPQSSQAAYELGQLYVRKGDTEAAITQFRNAVNSDGDNVAARLALANVYETLDEPPEAEQQYEAALRGEVRDTDQLVDIGTALLASGKSDAAIDAFRRAAEQEPGNPRVHYYLGQAYLGDERYGPATEAELRVLELTDDVSDPALLNVRMQALVVLGDIDRTQNRPDEATNRYNQALTLYPEGVEATLGLGRVAVGRGLWGVALGHFERATTLPGGQENPLAQFWLGEALLHSGSYDRAITAYDQALALQPKFPEALLGKAQTYAAQNDIRAASATVEEALTQRNSYGEALLFQGRLLDQQGLNDQARVAYSSAIAANKDLPEPYYYRGMSFILSEDYNRAVEDFKRVTELRSDDDNAYYWLGRAYYAQGRNTNALRAFKQAVDASDGNFTEARFYQAQVEEDLNQRDDAVASYQAVLSSDSGSDWGTRARAALQRLESGSLGG